jgi:holo-[acyl-carrier protein] synthase
MAEIVGTGIDLIEVERVRAALERPATGARFRARVFTEREIAYCESRGLGRFQSYAARFAAKEAAMKAMGIGLGAVHFRDLEIAREPSGRPVLVLHGDAARRADALGVAAVHVSLTHTATTAGAVVVLERGEPGAPDGSAR